MTTLFSQRGANALAGFVATASVGVSIPAVILLIAPVAVGDGAGWPFDFLITPAGFVSAALVWLVVVAGGLLLGVRHPDSGFFRGTFLSSLIILGCVAVVLMVHLLGKLG